MANRVLVLGVGNTLFTDDGAGPLAVRAAASRWTGGGVDFAEALAGGLELLDLLTGYDAAIVVDAAITGKALPGEIFLVDPESLPALTGDGAHGAHLGTALEVAKKMGAPMPQRLEVLAIEVQEIATVGEELTPEVAQGIEPAAEAILALVRQVLQEGVPGSA